MKIVLAEAPFSYDIAVVRGERYFPLGIGYIASYVRQKPNRDVFLFVDGLDDFKEFVTINKPDVLGLSAMTASYPTCREMVKIAKSANPSCVSIIGGQHATSVGETVFSEIPEIDFIAMGEGEILMDKFLDEIESGSNNWGSVPGLIYRSTDGKTQTVPPQPVLQDLDELPFPARDLLPLEKFPSHAHMRFGAKTVSLISSRGCPWPCTYCSSHVTMGRKYRYRSPKKVVDEMEELYLTQGVDNFIFWDDVFTFRQERVFEFCSELKSRRMNVNWWCMSRTDRMTQELANAMADMGCVMVSFGIESGSEKTLKLIKKRVNLKVAREAVQYCNKARIRTQGTFILGLPFETMEDINLTINFAKTSGLDMALFFSFTPFPGTEEWKNVPEDLKPKSIKEWHSFVCNTQISRSWNPRFSDEEIAEIVLRAHRAFYYRPIQIWKILLSLRSMREFKSYVISAFSLTYSIVKKVFSKKKY